MNEDAEQLLDTVIGRTAEALQAMSDNDIPEDQALCMLVGAYIANAIEGHNPADTAAGYAVALHRLVNNRAYITELEDKIGMLETLDEIRGL